MIYQYNNNSINLLYTYKTFKHTMYWWINQYHHLPVIRHTILDKYRQKSISLKLKHFLEMKIDLTN